MCGGWFHTSFIEPDGHLVLMKEEIDVACKDSKNQKFESDFRIRIEFKNAVQPIDDMREPIGIKIFQYSKVRVCFCFCFCFVCLVLVVVYFNFNFTVLYFALLFLVC